MTLSPSRSSPEVPVPRADNLDVLRSAAATCQACPLYLNATQTVFGEGPSDAPLMLVGEQPGDSEDRAGRVFVGAAGRLLDQALADAGIDRAKCYVTNAVKHFKWEPKKGRRMHKKPSQREVDACRPWLQAELAAIRPRVLICLGATAVFSVLGNKAKVLRDRGKVFRSEFCDHTLVTVHPSALLRTPGQEDRATKYRLFVEDLRRADGLL